MTQKFSLDCAWCAERQSSSYAGTRCEHCNGSLMVTMDLTKMNRAGSLRDSTLPGLWAWFDLLPIADRGAIVSLGEGNTPLIPAPRLASRLGGIRSC